MKLIEFFATWCGPCKLQKPIVEKVTRDLGIEVELVDVDEFPEIAEKYGIKSVPVIIVLEQNDSVKKKLLGFHTEAKLKAALA